MKRKTKRFISILTSFILSISLLSIVSTSAFAKGDASETIKGNLIKITTKDDFSKGTLKNAEIDAAIGDGAVKLKTGSTDGEFVSQVFNVAPFQNMVASWNSDTPEGTWVEVFAKAYIDKNSEWTEWLSWGKWSPFIKRGCGESEFSRGKLAYVDTDTFTIRGNDSETASKLQLKVVLHSENTSATPVIRLLSGTYKNLTKGKEIKPLLEKDSSNLPAEVLLDTPAYSQMTRDFEISNSICSPTTIATLLNDRGENLLPEEVALNCFDFNYNGFGNWAFSVATAGSYGYESYVQFADMNILREELAKGYSVGISVSYSNKEGHEDPPYVEGAPITTTGHLISIRGYKKIDGIDYFFVSDSAADSDKSALCKFKADQLNAAWSNRVAYIVHNKEQNAGNFATQRYKAELKSINGGNDYELYVDGKKVELSENFLRSKISESGGGTLAYIFDDSVAAAVEKPSVTTMANRKFGYEASLNDNGNIHLDPNAILKDENSSEKKQLTVYIISNSGKMYIAPVSLEKKQNIQQTAVQSTKNSQKKPLGNFLTFAIGTAAAILIAGICAFAAKKIKQKQK